MDRGSSARARGARSLAAAALGALAVVALAPLVGAQQPPSAAAGCSAPGVDDRCEDWSTTYREDVLPASSSQFAAGVAASPDGRRVYAAIKNVTGSGFDADSTWAIAAFDGLTGQQLWVARYGAAERYSFPTALALSPDGATVVASGTDKLEFADPEGTLVTIAFDAASGTELWRATYNGSAGGTDNARRVAIGPMGDTVYVGGMSGSGGNLDYVIVAYDLASGAPRWLHRYDGGHGVDSLFGLAVAPDESLVFATGQSAGEGEFNLDFATIAVHARGPGAGERAWLARFQGAGDGRAPDEGRALAVGPDGRTVVVAGRSHASGGGPPFQVDYDYVTVAYDAATGAQRWLVRRDWPGATVNTPTALAIDPAGAAAVVTGQVSGSQQSDIGTVAYRLPDGVQLWEDRYGLAEHDLETASDALAAGGRVFVTGLSSSSRTRAIFANQAQAGDALTLAYRLSDGSKAWLARYNATGYDFDSGAGLAHAGDRLFVLADLKHNISFEQNFFDTGVLAYGAAAGPGPSPSPSPTASPTASPSPSPSASPSPSPSASGAPPPPPPEPSATPPPSPPRSPEQGPSPALSPSPSGAPPSPSGAPPSPSGAPPSPVAGGPAPGAARAELEASRARITSGAALTLTGTLSTQAPCAGDEVEILRRRARAASFGRLAIVRARGGVFSYRDLPLHSAQYAARPLAAPGCAAQTSSVVSVEVAARVGVRPHGRCAASAGAIAVRVRPDKHGDRVLLQRRSGGLWAETARARLDRRSRTHFGGLGCGRYRVLWPSQDDLNARGARRARLR